MSQVPFPLELDSARLADVCGRLGLRMLVLFGSRATGAPPPHAESDLDLAMSFSAGTRADYWSCQAELMALFPHESLDLVVLNDADPLFRWEIMREAVLLWGDPDDFLELRAFAYRDFVDSADLRALERTLSEKKLARILRQLGPAS